MTIEPEGRVPAPTSSLLYEWLPLLRRLTAREPDWFVWKNADAAISGNGDVDSMAPPRAWGGISGEFRAWAASFGAGPVVTCTHAPGSLVAVACVGADRRELAQLDVYERVGRIAHAELISTAAELDPRGFRRLPPGAEGLLLLLALSRRPGRKPKSPDALVRIGSLLRSDPEGAEKASRGVGLGGSLALRGARAVADGRWNVRAMAALELVYAERAIVAPSRRLAWLRFRLSRESCPVLGALADGRRIQGDVDAWLRAVSSNHTVFDT
jgi:hypothetical protein